MNTSTVSGLALPWLLSCLLVGCLPKDTRPPPASVLVEMSAGEATLQGIPAAATADGWEIAFDRVLVAVGKVSLDGSSCSDYSEARYVRVFDAGVAGTQKLSESFALGQCDFGFRMTNAEDDSLLGSGATPADVIFMRTPGSDVYAGVSGISAFVQGHARREGSVKSFSWSFRQRFSYSECTEDTDAGPVRGLGLAQSGAVTVGLEIHGEALFADNLPLSSAALRFGTLADADTVYGNDDGDISLDELANVPLTDLRTGGLYAPPSTGPDFGKTLRDYLYLGAFPQLIQYSGGQCKVKAGRGD